MGGEVNTDGETYEEYKITVSEKPLTLGAVTCKTIGLDIGEVPILHSTIEAKLGECDTNNIEIIGVYNKDNLPVYASVITKLYGETTNRNSKIKKALTHKTSRGVI